MKGVHKFYGAVIFAVPATLNYTLTPSYYIGKNFKSIAHKLRRCDNANGVIIPSTGLCSKLNGNFEKVTAIGLSRRVMNMLKLVT